MDGCGRPHYGLGFCQKHWYRFKHYGERAGEVSEGYRGEIDPTPFRDMALKRVGEGYRWADLCERAGWPRSDTSRLQRSLGMRGSWCRGRKWPPTRLIRYETAVTIAHALGADPVDLGL